MQRRYVWLGATILGVTGCSGEAPREEKGAVELRQAFHQAGEGDMVRRWIENGLDSVRAETFNAASAGRLYAMLTIAMYDAVNGIDVANGGGRDHALVEPLGAPANGRRDAAAMGAAHAVLILLVPQQAAALHAAREQERALLGSSPAVQAGESWGVQVGHQVVARRNFDGSEAADIIPAGSAPGEFRAPFDARWASMDPFGVDDATDYVSKPPPPLTSRAYAKAFEDVKTVGQQDDDPLRNEISTFWLAGGGTVQESGTWFQAALEIAEQEKTAASISEMARLFALLGMAIGDSVVTSWASKAEYFTWRPTTAIREADTDGNSQTQADPSWTSRIGSVGGTPEYTSGTSTFAGAASRVIERFYRDRRLEFCFETDLAFQPRCYPSTFAAAVEAGRSRIFQGIHFQFSNVAGRNAGRALADEIVTTRLR